MKSATGACHSCLADHSLLFYKCGEDGAKDTAFQVKDGWWF